MLRSALAVVAAAAVAVAAVVNAVTGGSDEGARPTGAPVTLEGPAVPVPGGLSGTLLFAEACRVKRLDFRTLDVADVQPRPACRFWLSPGADAAVVGPGRRGGTAQLVALDEGGGATALGLMAGEPAWSPDGAGLAWCERDGATRLLDAAAPFGDAETVPGCRPRFGEGGSLFTAGRDELYRDGVSYLRPAALARGLPEAAGALEILGYDVREDGLVAVAVAGEPRREDVILKVSEPGPYGAVAGQSLITGAAQNGIVVEFGEAGRARVRLVSTRRPLVLELWRDGTLEQAIDLRELAYPFGGRRFGELVRFAPSGHELAVGAAGWGEPLMLLDTATLRPVLRPLVQQGFAWSPDGAWFALAAADGVRIAGAERSQPAYVLPLAATTIAWR